MPDAERQGLAEALRAAAPAYAGWLSQPETSLERYPAPFFPRLAIYKVIYHSSHHPLGFYAAWAPGLPAYLLSDEPQNFVAAALADGVSLDSAEAALAYARAYLDTTRAADELFYVLDSAEAVRFYPEMGEEEQQRADRFRATYAHIIAPPSAAPAGTGWRVTLYAMRQQALERLTLRLTPFGAVDITGQILEAGLPVVFAS